MKLIITSTFLICAMFYNTSASYSQTVEQSSVIIERTPEYGNRLHNYYHQKFEVNNLQLDTSTSTINVDRSPIGYDCTQLGVNCNQETRKMSTIDYQIFPDYKDSTSHFKFWDGYLISNSRSEAYRDYIINSRIVDYWLETHKNIVAQPVIVILGGKKFLINKNQVDFYTVEKRVCPSCVSFTNIADSDASMRNSIDVKLKFMKNEGIIPKNAEYHLILDYRSAEVWDEYSEVPELSDIIDVETTNAVAKFRNFKAPNYIINAIMANTILYFQEYIRLGAQNSSLMNAHQLEIYTKLFVNSWDQFVRKYLLTPHMLSYVKLVGPIVSTETSTSSLVYSRLESSQRGKQLLNMLNNSELGRSILELIKTDPYSLRTRYVIASIPIIGRELIRLLRISPWDRAVELWVKTKKVQLGPDRGRYFESIEDFINHERWDPTLRSPLASQYFIPTRSVFAISSMRDYLNIYGVSKDPEGEKKYGPGGRYSLNAINLYEDEIRYMRSDYERANSHMNRLLREEISIDQLFGRTSILSEIMDTDKCDHILNVDWEHIWPGPEPEVIK